MSPQPGWMALAEWSICKTLQTSSISVTNEVRGNTCLAAHMCHKANAAANTAVRYAIAYQPLTDALQVVDQELAHRYVVLKGREMGTTARLTSQNGTVSVSLKSLM